MSTRCTLSYDDDFHLYQECFEKDNVYLRLDKGDWSAALETAAVDWNDSGSRHPTINLRINVTMWRKIVEGWLESEWGKDPAVDHQKIEIDVDRLNLFLSAPVARKTEE